MPTVSKNPWQTEVIVSGWNYPERAYGEDGINTYASPPDESTKPEQKYSGFNFTESDIPPSSQITKVEMGAKHYETDPSGYIQYTTLKHVNSLGSTSTYQLTRRTSLTWDWIDITSRETSWDLAKLNNADVRIISEIHSAGGGGGCNPTDVYFLGKDEGGWIMRRAKELKEGDVLLAWHPEKGLIFSKVKSIQSFTGLQKLITLFLPKLKFPSLSKKGEIFEWQPHLTVTGQHQLYFAKKGSRRGEYAWFMLKSEELHTRMMSGEKDFYVGTLWKAETLAPLPLERVDLHEKVETVYKVTLIDEAATLFADQYWHEDLALLKTHGYGLRETPMSMPLLSQLLKQTSYVDTIVLRATYALLKEMQITGEGLTCVIA
jgi:hypothetical protein